MDSALIAGLSFSATIIAAIVGALMPTLFKKHAEKVAKRVVPIISIWCNSHDDIDARLRQQNPITRWFLELDKLEDYSKKNYLYVTIRSESKYRMLACKANICMINDSTKHKDIREFNIGSIEPKQRWLLPIPFDKDNSRVECVFDYLTELKEKMRYRVTFMIKSSSNTVNNRTDQSFRVRTSLIKGSDGEQKGKEILLNECKFNTTESFTSNEIKKKLGANGSLNYLKKENE